MDPTAARHAVIVSAARSPIGRRNGVLATIAAGELGGMANATILELP